MKLRIKQYPKGFVVEALKPNWIGRYRWTHFISVAGISSVPWHYSSYDMAEKQMLLKVKWDAIVNSRSHVDFKQKVEPVN